MSKYVYYDDNSREVLSESLEGCNKHIKRLRQKEYSKYHFKLKTSDDEAIADRLLFDSPNMEDVQALKVVQTSLVHSGDMRFLMVSGVSNLFRF